MQFIDDISAADDSAARRAAKKVGLRIVRSRWRRYSIDKAAISYSTYTATPSSPVSASTCRLTM
jgi:hypothetical protein